jgi:4'-phosphopantetheinyl transferase
VWLHENQVDVWWAELEQIPERLNVLRSTLSADELTRAARFRRPELQEHFVAARGILRSVLGQYLNCAPSAVSFAYGEHGKPRIADGQAAGGLQFNLSHSGQHLAVAIAHQHAIGVDIELICPGRDIQALAKRFFAPQEARALAALSPAERPLAFFACWTRKEAFLKALGDGLSRPLRSFTVNVEPCSGARLLSTEWDPSEAARWSLCDLELTGYRCAVAVRGSGWTLRRFEWE